MAGPDVIDELENLSFGEGRRLEIVSSEDRLAAASIAQEAALALGFPSLAAARAMLVASELAGNATRHAGGGQVEISACRVGTGLLRIVVRDQGPPFSDLELAFTDGCSDRGPIAPEQRWGRLGLGSGLGAVRRMSLAVVIKVHGNAKSVIAYVSPTTPPGSSICPVAVKAFCGRVR